MILALYSLATWLAQPLLRRKLRRRGVAEPGYLRAVDERFGRYTTARPDGRGPLVWIHAVSLGETRAAAILLAALRERLPTMRLLLTHGTATGRAEGQKLLGAGDVQVWQPWDTRGATRRFLTHFKPDVGLLMETEIWPNQMHEAAARGVPMVLANARLSEKSLRGAQRAGLLLRPAYRALTAAWAQSEADAARLRTIGVRQVDVLGNLKFDARPDAAQQVLGPRWRAALGGRPVVMLASSREGEEVELLEQIKALALDGPARAAIKNEVTAVNAPLWLIVPRHPQRFAEVADLARAAGFIGSLLAKGLADAGGTLALCDVRGDDVRKLAQTMPGAAGFEVAQRSRWADAPSPDALTADVWIGETLGEMTLYYSLADVALLGGSFAPLGGQNLIEAAACGCPVVMGPHTFNFAQAAELAEAAARGRHGCRRRRRAGLVAARPRPRSHVARRAGLCWRASGRRRAHRRCAGSRVGTHQGLALKHSGTRS